MIIASSPGRLGRAEKAWYIPFAHASNIFVFCSYTDQLIIRLRVCIIVLRVVNWIT